MGQCYLHRFLYDVGRSFILEETQLMVHCTCDDVRDQWDQASRVTVGLMCCSGDGEDVCVTSGVTLPTVSTVSTDAEPGHPWPTAGDFNGQIVMSDSGRLSPG